MGPVHQASSSDWRMAEHGSGASWAPATPAVIARAANAPRIAPQTALFVDVLMVFKTADEVSVSSLERIGGSRFSKLHFLNGRVEITL